MKRLLLLILVLFTVAACSAANDNNNEETPNENNDTNIEVDNDENEDNDMNNENNEAAETNEEGESENEVVVVDEENEDDENYQDAANAESEDLTLQLTKTDEEAGIAIETDSVYSELNNFILENPNHGEPDDLSIYVVNTLENEEGNHLVLFAINRLGEPVKNISFNYTLGIDEDELLFDSEPVMLSEEEFGQIEVNHAMPFTLAVDEEQLDIMSRITDENQIVEFDNVDLEFVENE